MNKNIIITIGREFGSYGHKVGEILSKKLNIPYYDKQIISIAAKESGYAKDLFEAIDEKQTVSFLFSIAMGIFSYGNKLNLQDNDSLTDKLFAIQKSVITDLANKESCIIIGRCSNYILRNSFNCINVFIRSDFNKRVSTVCKRENVNPDKAKIIINETDKERANYYRYYTGEKWGNKENYDIIINIDMLGIEGTVELIEYLYRKKSLQFTKKEG